MNVFNCMMGHHEEDNETTVVVLLKDVEPKLISSA